MEKNGLNLILTYLGFFLWYLVGKAHGRKEAKNYKAPVFFWRYTFNYNGFIIPYVGIIINSSLKESPLLNNLIDHEFVHWKQWKRYKSATLFIFLYLCDVIYHGYDLSLFEIEARFNENKWVKYNYTQAVRLGLANTPENENFRKGKKAQPLNSCYFSEYYNAKKEKGKWNISK